MADASTRVVNPPPSETPPTGGGNGKRIAIALLLGTAIIVIGISVPSLPSPRYVFREVGRERSYSNFFFPVLICDNWTGEVRYVAEVQYEQYGKDGRTKTEVPARRVLSSGNPPYALLIERYALLVAVGILVAVGLWLFRGKERTDDTEE